MLRKDRVGKSGDGVAAYCNNELNFKRRLDLECNSIEILWLEVFPYKSKRSLLMTGCYRFPSYKRCEYDLFDKSMENVYLKNKEIILTGDSNLDLKDQKHYKKQSVAKSLQNMNFKQLVGQTARPSSDTCLDHIYTNQSQPDPFCQSL